MELEDILCIVYLYTIEKWQPFEHNFLFVAHFALVILYRYM